MSREPIAIIGIGCRFPGASGPRELWRFLTGGGDAIREIPRDRFDIDALYHETPATPGRIMTRWGGFLDGLDRFDAQFFGISPREADRLDPQQRLLLEVGWEALEDGGQALERIDRAHTGIFVGTWLNDYEARLTRNARTIDFYTTTGTGRYSASGRLSYVFGFEGPSITVDCACSSSLVAVHLACRSLWDGESSLALAGGANVILEPYIHIAYSQSRMMAPDGRCKFGDAAADGYVRSEGAAIVVLKPLARALADGDPIYATILGGAVNNGGRSSGFLATPGQAGQETMLRRAYADAGVPPSACQYVEAHGTGTRVGDPVEVGAIAAVLGRGRAADETCLVGSIKTNIGHTEGAAGVAGLIKVALALKHGQIPASLHCHTPNPDIPGPDQGVQVNRQLSVWAPDRRAIAGVSAFGISGTNAHIVLQQVTMPEQGLDAPASTAYVVGLTAQSEAALRASAASWAAHLEAAPADVTVADVAYTAALRRTHHDRRLAVVASDVADLVERLQAWGRGESDAAIVTGTNVPDRRHKIAFVFPGQGSQWIGMGRRLLAEQPVFREAIAACDAAVHREAGWSVLDELRAEESVSRLTQIDVIQPVLFSVQVALAALWRHWGVEPAAVVGHSMGEVAASCVAGALSLDDAVRIICRRSRLLKRTSGLGAMAVVGLSFDAAASAIAGLEDRLSIAVSNSPRSTVLSGDPDAIDSVIASLERRDIFCRRVKVDVASHSPQMDPLQADLFAALQEVQPRAGEIPICSTVLAATVDGAEFDAGYWVRNLRQPVLFSKAVQQLIETGCDTFVEMSPHPLLASSVLELLEESAGEGVVVGSLNRGEDDVAAISRSVATLWATGRELRLEQLCPRGRVVALPTYPFQRDHHWLDVPTGRAASPAGRNGESLLGSRVSSPLPTFELECAVETDEWSGGVRYGGAALTGTGTLVAIASAVVRHHTGAAAFTLSGVEFGEPGIAAADRPFYLQTVLTRVAREGGSFSIHHRPDADPDAWVLASSGEFTAAPLGSGRTVDVADLRRSGTVEDAASFYARLAAHGIEVRSDRQTVREIRTTASGRLARLDVAACGDEKLANVLEACALVLATSGVDSPESIRVPSRAGRVRLWPDAGDAAYALVTVDAEANAACLLLDEAGAVRGEIENVVLRRVRTAAFSGAVRERTASWMYDLVWESVAPFTPDQALGARAWVVLGADSAVGAATAAAIERAGGIAVRVTPGSSFSTRAAGDFEIDAVNPDHYVRVFEDAAAGAAGRSPFVVFAADESRPDNALRAIMAARAVEQTPAVGPICYVTRGAQSLAASQAPDVQQALVWGVARALALEHPQQFGGILDLDPASPVDAAADAVVEFAGGGAERQVAVRSGKWFAPRLVPAKATTPSAIRLRSDAAYLVTGGLGRLGLQAATWLAANGAGHLVLLGRRGLPPRAAWPDLAPKSDAARQVKAIAALERLGAQVTVRTADASDKTAMRELFSGFGATLPPLGGIVHAAGRIDYRPVTQIGAAEVADVFRAKVDGTLVLDDLTRDGRHPLDFFVMFSSGASAWGSRYLAHYSAANHALEAIARARHAAGLPATAINWGWWEGGATTAEAEALFAQAGLQPMPADDALEAMGDVIAAGVPQRIVAAIDWKTFKPMLESVGSTLLDRIDTSTESAAAARPRGTLLRELESMPPGAVRACIEEHLRREVGAVIGRDPAVLDVSRGFFKLGMDSLMTVELRRRLEAALDRTLPATIAFEYPNIGALASFLAGQIGGAAVSGPPTAMDDVAAALDEQSDDELALMLDGEIARLLTEEERAN